MRLGGWEGGVFAQSVGGKGFAMAVFCVLRRSCLSLDMRCRRDYKFRRICCIRSMRQIVVNPDFLPC